MIKSTAEETRPRSSQDREDESVDTEADNSPTAAEGNSRERDSVPSDSPLALVQKDNKAIRRTRILVVLLLLLAALGTSYFVYYFTTESETDAFESDFVAVAERLVQSFLADTGRRMSQGATLAAGISMAMRAYDTNIYNLTIDEQDWTRLTQDALSIGRSPLVAFSPYLKNDEERKIFENYAAQDAGVTNEVPPCYLCGEGNSVLNPDALFEFPGTGEFKCGEVYEAGLAGGIPEEFCEVSKPPFLAACQCETDVEGQPTEDDDFDGWSNAQGLFRMEGRSPVEQEFQKGPYAPLWQPIAVLSRHEPNLYDQFSEPSRAEAIRQAIEGSTVVFSKLVTRSEDPFYERFGGGVHMTSMAMYYPIFAPDTIVPVGVAVIDTPIENYLSTVMPSNSDKVDVVIESSCSQTFTVRPADQGISFNMVGPGDLHDTSYDSDNLWRGSTYQDFEEYVTAWTTVHDTPQSELDYCRYSIRVHPTSAFEDEHRTNEPLIYAIATFSIFIFTTLVFGIYDFRVRRRQAKVMDAAIRTNNIVSSLFPQNVRDRMYEQKNGQTGRDLGTSKESRFQRFLNGEGDTAAGNSEDNVIADLFPHVTVLFLDLQGFTAWASEREPEQVFRLLERLYGSFDEVARTMGVFKVETIGDCYVSACGLPRPRDDHAVVMVRFADECFRRMSRVTHELEKFLGPSTGDLKARCGLHSGAVTAGVLRGEKARFQLFGDSMNVAARMESTGMPMRIHISQATADELRRHNKEHWLVKRPDKVFLKGKGQQQTYFAVPRTKRGQPTESTAKAGSEVGSSMGSDDMSDGPDKAEKLSRLIDWNVEVLMQHLQPVVNSRAHKAPSKENIESIEQAFLDSEHGIVASEMTDIISMPDFDPMVAQAMMNEGKSIPDKVKNQLRDFVAVVACAYRDTPFHNFDHCSRNVMMSAGKLMKRIVSPERLDVIQGDPIALARAVHDSTYGISSDPLTLFAVVFSALIHDVDHTGLTNAELIQIKTPLAALYQKKSVAEQNSVDLAWDMLMGEEFSALRACIYTNKEEFLRFRQLVVNIVMATDIADKEFQTLRKDRWRRAFDDDTTMAQDKAGRTDTNVDMHRKATIVLEHIIQASDVAHTMQHWHVYIKYNRLLFEERYRSWLKGVAGEKDPSLGWYKGEIGFFDFYIIPLARKLDRCGVFGVSYHEYLQYAISNRAEWEEKGEDMVAGFLSECRAKYGSTQGSLSINA